MSFTIPEFHPPLRDLVSRLQDTNAQIRDVARYVCDVATGLAGEEASLNALTYKTLRELGEDAWTAPSDSLSAGEIHTPLQTRKPVDPWHGNPLTVPTTSG